MALSYQFVHSGLEHIGFNIILQLLFGEVEAAREKAHVLSIANQKLASFDFLDG